MENDIEEELSDEEQEVPQELKNSIKIESFKNLKISLTIQEEINRKRYDELTKHYPQNAQLISTLPQEVIDHLEQMELGYGIFRDDNCNAPHVKEQELEEDQENEYNQIDRSQILGPFKYYNNEYYHGQLYYGNKDGYGLLYTVNGDLYNGYFKDDLYHGKGRILFMNMDFYEGYFKQGKRRGMGEFWYGNGNYYNGEYLNDMRHGICIEEKIGYNHYSGKYSYDKKVGQGKLEVEGEYSYEGQFENDLPNGKGILQYVNGTRYIGEFHQGKFNGKGEFWLNEQDFYLGEFKDQQPHGQGKLLIKNWGIYNGTWYKGYESNQGTFQIDKSNLRVNQHIQYIKCYNINIIDQFPPKLSIDFSELIKSIEEIIEDFKKEEVEDVDIEIDSKLILKIIGSNENIQNQLNSIKNKFNVFHEKISDQNETQKITFFSVRKIQKEEFTQEIYEFIEQFKQKLCTKEIGVQKLSQAKKINRMLYQLQTTYLVQIEPQFSNSILQDSLSLSNTIISEYSVMQTPSNSKSKQNLQQSQNLIQFGIDDTKSIQYTWFSCKGQKEVPFPRISNLILEQALINDEKEIHTFTYSDKLYRINLNTFEVENLKDSSAPKKYYQSLQTVIFSLGLTYQQTEALKIANKYKIPSINITEDVVKVDLVDMKIYDTKSSYDIRREPQVVTWKWINSQNLPVSYSPFVNDIIQKAYNTPQKNSVFILKGEYQNNILNPEILTQDNNNKNFQKFIENNLHNILINIQQNKTQSTNPQLNNLQLKTDIDVNIYLEIQQPRDNLSKSNKYYFTGYTLQALREAIELKAKYFYPYGQQATIDFLTKEEIQKTQKYKIKREFSSYLQIIISKLEQQKQNLQSNPGESEHIFQIKGLEENVQQVFNQIRILVNDQKFKNELNVKLSNQQIQKLQELCWTSLIDLQYDKDQKKLVLKGEMQLVLSISAYVLQTLSMEKENKVLARICAELGMSSSIRNKNIKQGYSLSSLNQASDEFKTVNNLFLQTMPKTIKITKIEKIKNDTVYTRYLLEKKLMEEKLERTQNIEYLLFHGTSSNDPSIIYKEGFLMQFGRDNCYWGKGIYFAEKASYSDSYRHTNQKNQFQIFCAQVLIGDYKDYGVQKLDTLKLPPLKPNQTDRYDSVKGNTVGSPVYAVYENFKCFPTYLITYVKKQ